MMGGLRSDFDCCNFMNFMTFVFSYYVDVYQCIVNGENLYICNASASPTTRKPLRNHYPDSDLHYRGGGAITL